MKKYLNLPILFLTALILSNSCQKERVIILPTIKTSTVTDITNTSAISGGTITDDGGSKITSRGVCWSNLPDSTKAISHLHCTEDSLGLGEFNSHITGLKSGTKYYVRAYAVNSVGIAFGDTVSFVSFNATPVSGSVYADSTDYFSASLNNYYSGRLFVDWSSYNNNTWQVSLGNHPDQQIDLSQCVIILPGSSPPTKSASYTLQPNYSTLTANTACIYYSGFKFREFPFHYYSTSGLLNVAVVNGQISVAFSNIPANGDNGETLTMSGHITCH